MTQKQLIRRLRRDLRFIRDLFDAHAGEQLGEDVTQFPDCYCARCVAVRALALKPGKTK